MSNRLRQDAETLREDLCLVLVSKRCLESVCSERLWGRQTLAENY